MNDKTGDNMNDLLDLCRLNLLETNNEDNLTDDDKKAIKFSKSKLVKRVIQDSPKFTKKQLEAHKKTYTVDGVYPVLPSTS